DFDIDPETSRKQATRINWTSGPKGAPGEGVDLTEDDLLAMSLGSVTERSDAGDQPSPATLEQGPAPAWVQLRKIAGKDPAVGRPRVFADHIPDTKWESATVTTLDERIPKYSEKITKRDPYSGKVVTGGIVTAKDSSWLTSWTVNRQP